MGAVTARKPPRLTLAGLGHTEDDYRQLPRLEQFAREHPGVVQGRDPYGNWHAVISGDDGETLVVRERLRDLLDKLDELLPPDEGGG